MSQQIKMEFTEGGYGTAVVLSSPQGQTIPIREIETKLQRFLMSAGFPVTAVGIMIAEVPSE